MISPPPAAIVTGANTGLGLASATALAADGWDVTLAVRNTEKGDAAATLIEQKVPAARLQVRRLDLADLESVREFAAGTTGQLQLLMNNAGVMLVPQRTITGEGFEQHMGVNYLGHHLLTSLLLPALTTGAGRVVSVSSIAHLLVGRIDRSLGLEGRYAPMRAYGNSKLAALMFAREFDRRLRASGSPMTSVAAHPGWSATDLTSPRERGDDPSFSLVAARKISQWSGSSPEHGARSQLLAGTSPATAGGSFLGPRLLAYGKPAAARASKASRNTEDLAWLWQTADELTGARWDFAGR